MPTEFTKERLDAVWDAIETNPRIKKGCPRCSWSNGAARAYLSQLRAYFSEEEVFCFFFAAQYSKIYEGMKFIGYVWPELLMRTLQGRTWVLDEIFSHGALYLAHCSDITQETKMTLDAMLTLKINDIFSQDRRVGVHGPIATVWAIPLNLHKVACKLEAEQKAHFLPPLS